MLNSFTWAFMLLPLAMYFLVIGLFSARRRPIVVSGTRDVIAIGLGCMGFVLAGPAQLFFPQAAFNLLGVQVWFALLLLYLLIVGLLAISLRPRTIVYAAGTIDVNQELKTLLAEMDAQTSWAGLAFDCPQLEINGVVEQAVGGSGALTAQIVASSRTQNLGNWILLREMLQQQVAKLPQGRRHFNQWLAIAFGLVVLVGLLTFTAPQETLAGLRDLFRL